jgi:adenylate cyclase
VFDAMLDKAMRLSDSVYGHLLTYDGEFFDRVAVRGNTRWSFERQSMRRRAESGITLERIVRGESVVQIADVMDTDAYRSGNLAARVMVDEGDCRTLLTVALRKEDILLGTLSVYRRGVRPFNEKQISLLENFAAQAVIAMENARLITETREALEQQTATAEVLQIINSSPGDLGPVFSTLIETAARLCKSDFAHLMTRDGAGYRAVASFAHSPEFDSFIRSRLFTPGRETVAGRTALEGGVVHIVDLAADPEFALPEAVNLGKLRSVLGVPLLYEGKSIGVITLSRQRVEPFTDRQIDLVRTFADQAVIAMENARLITETREALDHQTATAEVLGVINASPGDLTPVFEAILDVAMVSCGAAFGEMHTYDGVHFHAAALRGVPEFRRRGPTDSSSGTIIARVLEGERIIHVVDLKAEEPYRLGDPQRRSLVDIGGARTALVVAFRAEHALLGLLMIYRQEVRPFTDKQIALLENFAAQAVIAMENARLLGELRQRTDEVAELNRGLEARVAEQVDELGRVGRLKRFLAPQLAELIVSHGDEKILESHRREIVVVFCDLRGYTAFTETAEPEEVLDFLREYHGALGPLVSQYEGTLDQFSGDGIMVFFNDPMPIPDPAERAVKMAVAMREAAGTLIAHWRERGRDLGFGAGIAQGYATLGQIGFSERSGYTAIGTVCNVAARLCAEAKDGQILLSQRINVALKGSVVTEQIGALALKGFTQPVVAYNVPLAATQPALRIIEGGPQSV